MAEPSSRLEQETIITFNNSEPDANVWSKAPTWIAQIKKLGGKQDGSGFSVNVPKSWIKVAKPISRSQKQIEAARKSLAKAREAAKERN